MSPPLPLAVTSISFLYVEKEDRLALIVSSAAGDQLALLMTRRLAIRVINGLAGLLERTSAKAQEAPAEVRGDVVMFEHQGAVATADHETLETPGVNEGQGKSRQAPQATDDQQQVATVLFDSIDVTTHPDRFTLGFRAGQQLLAGMDVSRSDLHRIVAVLCRKVEDAQWQIPIETTWLDISTGSLTLN